MANTDTPNADTPVDAGVTVYISREASEVEDLLELASGAIDSLPWIGLLNGKEIPVTLRLGSDRDEQDALEDDEDGTSGQDRESYTDDQDRDNYT